MDIVSDGDKETLGVDDGVTDGVAEGDAAARSTDSGHLSEYRLP